MLLLAKLLKVILLLSRLLKIILLLGRLLGYKYNRYLRVILLLNSSQYSLLWYKCSRQLRYYRGRYLHSKQYYNYSYRLSRLLRYRCNKYLRVILLLSSSQYSLLGYRCNRQLKYPRGRCLYSKQCYSYSYRLS